MKLKFLTSNNPLSAILISGITGKDKNDKVKNDKVKNGLKIISGAMLFKASCNLSKSEVI